MLRDCPQKLRELAMVPFNTRLVADLVADGAVSKDFTTINSQIALLDLYWERRIERHGTAAEGLSARRRVRDGDASRPAGATT